LNAELEQMQKNKTEQLNLLKNKNLANDEISELIKNHPEYIQMKEMHDHIQDKLRTQNMNIEIMNKELSTNKKKELIMLKEVMDKQNEN
tara:strand:- start:165 stop:431 length:267 start_codon:yes stop_codon:yes gene_type:complete